MKRSVLSIVTVAVAILASSACVASVTPSEQGRAFYNSGNYLFAADAFTEAIQKDPRSVAAWNNRAVTRVRLGDLNGAIRDYNRAVELAPNDAELYFNRGNALVGAGQYQAAIIDYDRAVQIAPTYARAIFNRGTAHALAAQPDAARLDWQAAIALEPDPFARSAMRHRAGLEPAVAAAPQPAAAPLALDARALTTRAVSRELDGDHAGAMQDLNAALAIEPDAARREAIVRLIQALSAPR